ncbi:MAG: Pr6Pr family membrane protein [Propionibacteriaceae bacterium]
MWHGLTAAVGAFGLVAQLILVIDGAQVLVTDERLSLGERLLHFFSYFTVLSNLLVLVSAVTLLRNPARDSAGWRVLRLSGLTGIIVTGIVHWFFLRPLLDLTGWSYAVDKVLHVAVPLLAAVGWALFGPRPRVSGRTYGLSLLYPAVWLVYILALGAATGWYPYPFLDVDELGGGRVAVVCLALTGAIVLVAGLLWWGDRKLPAGPVPSPLTESQPGSRHPRSRASA